MGRVHWIDSAKAVGIILVVWGHALPRAGVLPAVIWAFHMPLFFLLSGLTARPGSSMTTVAVRRSVTSLLIPYFVFSAVSIGLWLAATGQLSSAATWARVLGEAAYGISGGDAVMRYNTPLWFFTCLLSVRMIFIGLTARAIKPGALALLTAAIALGAHLSFASGLPRLPWNIDVACMALVFYCAGYLMRKADLSALRPGDPRVWPAIAMSVGCLVAAVAANGQVDMNARYFGSAALFYVGAFAGIFLAVIVAKAIEKSHWVRQIGIASSVIFPVHLLLAYVAPARTFQVIHWYGLRISGSDELAALGVACVQVALCMPVYFAISRWAPWVIGQRGAPHATLSVRY